MTDTSSFAAPAALCQNYSDIVEFGSGSHGVLYRATQMSSGRQVVLKKISKSSPPKRIRLEIEAGTRLRGVQGVPYFHNHYEDNENMWLALDCVEGNDLLTWMENSDFSPVPEKMVKHIATHIVRILHRVHNAGFAHKDIKLENIIYNDKTRQVSLIDFGLCFNMRKEQTCRDFAGSKEYAAPEMLISRSAFCPKKVDVWALGVTLYALFFGMFPFSTDAKSEERMLRSKKHPIVHFPNSKVSAEAKDLLAKMICVDASARIQADQILSHPFFGQKSGSRPGSRNNSPRMPSAASEREV